MAILLFRDAILARDAILVSQQRQIAKLYENWAKEIEERAKYYDRKTNATAPISAQQMRELSGMLRRQSKEVSNEIFKGIKENIYRASDAVVKSNAKWMAQFGFSEAGINAAFNHVPDHVVRRLVTGQIYESGWSLSARIWGSNQRTLQDIYRINAGGQAMNKSIYEIAKDLEQYVKPGAKKPWNLVDKDGRKIYPRQVDYNAQRLARTLVQHGYQQSVIETSKPNPFITGIIWRANGSRACELCLSRDGTFYKLEDVPMDHPNGMCVMEPAVDPDMESKLASWISSPDGTYPEIDRFAKNFT